jgi:hypothetical protein
VAIDELRGDTATPGVRAVVEHWTGISAAWFGEGWELTRLVRGRLALELRAILRGVALVIGHLRRLDHDPLATHIRLTRGEKLRAVGGALLICDSSSAAKFRLHQSTILVLSSTSGRLHMPPQIPLAGRFSR